MQLICMDYVVDYVSMDYVRNQFAFYATHFSAKKNCKTVKFTHSQQTVFVTIKVYALIKKNC